MDSEKLISLVRAHNVLYNTHHSDYIRTTIKDELWEKIGEEMGTNGGWYILRDWNMADFDYNSILKDLHVKYGVSPYFKISVQPNPRFPGTNSITISPSGLGLPDRSYYYTPQNDTIQIAYKLLIRDVVISLSATKTLAEKFGEDIFYYEKRIAEITPHSFDINNPVNAYNQIKISELKITAPSLPLQDILTAMFPEANITEETEVIVTSLDYLIKVSLITATTDRAMVNSYVIWTLARRYLPYLSSQLTSTEDSFNLELLGIRKAIPRWEKCARLVQNFMGLAIQSLFESETPIDTDTRIIVNQIFREIVKAAKDKLRNYRISPHLFKYLLNKLNNLQLQIGLPDVVKSENYLKLHYNKLIILKTNLFESFKNGLSFLKKSEEKSLNFPNPEDQLVYYASNYPLEVRYAASRNTIVVPRGVLTTSVFEHSYPRSIQYGRLGIKIANAVISSIFPDESSWSAELKLLTPFHSIVNESQEVINTTTTCLTNLITNLQLSTENTEQAVTLSAFKHISSVDLAVKALVKSLVDNEHIHQPSLEKFEDTALFFITYIQGQCSKHSKQQELFNNVVEHKLTYKSEFEASWWMIHQFSEDLGCLSKKQVCSNTL